VKSRPDRDRKGTVQGQSPTFRGALGEILRLPQVRARLIEQEMPADLDGLTARLARIVESELTAEGQQAFATLCDKEGCHRTILGMILLLKPHYVQSALRVVIGPLDKRERKAAIRKLEEAASVLGSFAGSPTKGMDPASEARTNALLTVLNPIFLVTRRAVPFRIARQLRMCIHTLKMASALDSRSAVHFPKFLVSAYVQIATDKPHDREVARLIAEAFGLSSYDARQHKMWRHRNYARLQKAWIFVPELLKEVDHEVRSAPPPVTVS
jgi:hypothetical protein